MKKFLFFIFLFLLACGFFYFKKNSQPTIKKATEKPTPPNRFDYSNNRSKDKNELKKSVFVPYWTSWETPPKEEFQRLIYFGVAVNNQGVSKDDSGYEKLPDFNVLAGKTTDKWLTIRMTNTEINLSILNNQSSWQKITLESCDIAQNYNFSGLVLDLEIASLPLDKLVNQVNKFVEYFYKQTRSRRLKLAVIIYGDVFFRQRPFDVKFISQNSDEIMIMAYDFHKSFGEPGPNFPLSGREKYGYDLTKATDDFLSVVSAKKLTFVFGFYGYDWTVDEEQRPIKQAKALTLNQIKTKFGEKSENIKRDPLSTESFIKYTDENNMSHVVWFEDEKSVAKKQEFLKSKGINSFAHWAWGYY